MRKASLRSCAGGGVPVALPVSRDIPESGLSAGQPFRQALVRNNVTQDQQCVSEADAYCRGHDRTCDLEDATDSHLSATLEKRLGSHAPARFGPFAIASDFELL